MNETKCLIIEDEPLAAEILQEYISQTPFLTLEAIAPDAIYALEILQQHKIDLIFLDIHLPRLKGLDFIKTLKHHPQVIVTTAYREYAVDGFELNVIDYLLKPISFNRFLTAVNKLRNPLLQQTFVPASGLPFERKYMLININKKKIKIFLDEILYIESRKEYICIITKDKSYLTKFQLGGIDAYLNANNFIRVHRSFIVAKEKITAFTTTEIEINSQQIPIGRSYRDVVMRELGEAL